MSQAGVPDGELLRVSSADAGLSPVHAMLRPRSLAIYGASASESTFGHSLLAASLGWAYAGRVFPVNPRYDALAGITCYPDLASLPEVVDCVAFAVRDERLPEAMTAAASAGARAGVVFSRGYHPPGTARPTPTGRWSAIAREAGIAVCGDNCMGFTNFVDRLRVSGYPVLTDEPPGGVVLLSHSGSSWSGLIGSQRQIGLSHAVSIGSETVTGLADYVEFALDEPDTRVIALILETVRAPGAFARALQRAAAQGVPVVALKLGRSEQGRHFARSHSGAIAGAAAAFDAFFEHHGVANVRTLDELTDTVEMLRGARVPSTDAVGFGTDSGGERELICDVAADVGVELATFSAQTRERLAGVLDPGLEAANPVDYWGDGRIYFRECLQIIAEDPQVGAVVMATNMVSGRELLRITTETIVAVAAGTAKPVAQLGHLHSTIDREAAARLRAAGIPVLMGTATGLQALRHFFDHHRRLRKPARKQDLPSIAPQVAQRWGARLARAGTALPIGEALELLAGFGCPVAPGRVVSDVHGACEAARSLGFPVVAKTASTAVAHRSDVGAVHLGITGEAELAAAYQALAGAFGAEVLVQRQCEPGVELLFGVVVDEALGPMATVALGGIFVEVYRDVVTFVPPVDARRALALLRRLLGYALLEGARGRPRCDLEALARALSAFSVLAATLGSALAEADVNPVIAGPRGVMAVDALFVPRPRCVTTRK
jgi:acyl-CoA synthetase (NDP forming)